MSDNYRVQTSDFDEPREVRGVVRVDFAAASPPHGDVSFVHDDGARTNVSNVEDFWKFTDR